MRRFWKKQLPAALLALIMMVSLVPAALAVGCTSENGEHTWGDWTLTNPPTCNKDGVETRTCGTCQESETRTVPATGAHDYQQISNTATCGADGIITEKCAECGHEITRESPATGKHDWNDDGPANPAATCGKDGSQPQKCSICGATQTVTIPKTNAHNWGSWVETTKATCTTAGLRTATCTICQTPKTEAINALGHVDSNKDGKCDRCGYQMTTGYTVNFYYLTASGSSVSTSSRSYTVPLNNSAYTYSPSTPDLTDRNGTTYTFKGWTTEYGSSSWYLYTNQRLLNLSTYYINTNTTFYAVYTTDEETEITISVDPGKTEYFDEDDFRAAYREATGEKRADLESVIFTLDSDYKSFSGDLYIKNTKLSSYSAMKNYEFYYDKSDADGRDEYGLEELSLRADKDADDDSITMSYKAYGDEGTVSGTVKLVVGDDKDDKDVTITVKAGGKQYFDEDDFRAAYRSYYNKNATLDYVTFSGGSSTTYNRFEGSVYLDKDELTYSKLTSGRFYYNKSSLNEIEDLSLQAGKNADDDSLTLTFTAYGDKGSMSGKLKLVVGEEKENEGDITLKVTPGKSVSLSSTTFRSFLRDACDDNKAVLDYVVFDRPSSSSVFSDGTLYANYGKSGQVSFTQSNLSGYSFYYNSKDATTSKKVALDDVTFVAGTRFKDSIELSFTAYGDDDEEEEGTLVIQADGTAAAASNYVGSIRYATTTGTRVQFNANDFARYYKRSAGGTLQYVSLASVPVNGSLYYNYYKTSKYGTASQTLLTASNYGSQNFYANPSSTNQYALTELTYVPSGSGYCATIPFTAYGSTGAITGAVLISISTKTVAEVYGVTPKNTAVTFPASSIQSAVKTATGASSVASIQLLSLPAYAAGTVYVGTGTTPADTKTAYSIFTGGGQSLRFVPSTGYTGNVEIPYVALNVNGTAIASGTFSLGVVNAKKSFKDVKDSTWCYKYVAELSDAGVISGYSDGSFKPDSRMTYGAALKLVMLAAGYPEQAPTVKNSVFSGYLAKAQADGIVTRGNVNLSAPITRLQVAQLAAGALKLSTSNLSTVKPFTDTSDLCVQALNAAGIVEGYFSNGTSTYKPGNTLTRGQVSAIVWRMQNYRKNG